VAKKKLKRGVFITFEGVEGCGKSTHSKKVFKHLKRLGYPCVRTREPGGTPVGKKIRKILLDPKNKRMNDLAELFLFEASRAQIVGKVISPALAKNKIVICDRFFDATTVYQGYADGLDKAMIKTLNMTATGGLTPDLTIIMDIGIRKGMERATKYRKKDRMEEKPLKYHDKVRKGYLDVAKKEPGRVKLIKTKDDKKETQESVKREVMRVIQRHTHAR